MRGLPYLMTLACLVGLGGGCHRGAAEIPRAAREAVDRGNTLLEQAHQDRAEQDVTGEDYQKMTPVDPDSYGQAIAAYSQALALAPDYAEAYLRRGLAELEHNELQRAVEDFSQVIRIDPDNAYAYLYRSQAYEALGEASRSHEDRQKAEQLKPGLE